MGFFNKKFVCEHKDYRFNFVCQIEVGEVTAA